MSVFYQWQLRFGYFGDRPPDSYSTLEENLQFFVSKR